MGHQSTWSVSISLLLLGLVSTDQFKSNPISSEYMAYENRPGEAALSDNSTWSIRKDNSLPLSKIFSTLSLNFEQNTVMTHGKFQKQIEFSFFFFFWPQNLLHMVPVVKGKLAHNFSGIILLSLINRLVIVKKSLKRK